MNKLKILRNTIATLLIIITLPQITIAQAQYILQNEVESCTTAECDVVLTQYTGAVVGWSLHIRCMDASSPTGWSGWDSWYGGGVYSGSLCGG